MASRARPDLGAPPGLSVETFEAGGQEFAILELPARGPPVRPALTPAQEEVLALLLAGLSNRAIARRRGRSESTVAHQVAAIFRCLGVGSRLELFALISDAGGEGP